MNKKIYTTLLAAALLLAATGASAQKTFVPQNKAFWAYTVLSETDKTVEIKANPDYDFESARLNIIIPDEVTDPETNIKYTVTRIADKAFYNIQFSVLEIGSNVTTIGKNPWVANASFQTESYAVNPPVFEDTENLTALMNKIQMVRLHHENISGYLVAEGWEHCQIFKFRSGEFFCHIHTTEPGETEIEGFWDWRYKCPEILEIPAVIESGDLRLKVKGIRSFAFDDMGIREVKIPEGIETIGSKVFENDSNLTKATLPSTLLRIYEEAFLNCKRLADVHVPDGVTLIGNKAFAGTPFEAGFPDGPVYLGKVLYKYKGEIPDEVTVKEGTVSITGNTFSNSEIKTANLPASLEHCGREAFSSCHQLKNVNLPSIGNWFAINYDDLYSNPMSNNSCTLTVNGKTLQELKVLQIQDSIRIIRHDTGYNLDMSGCTLIFPEKLEFMEYNALAQTKCVPDTVKCYVPEPIEFMGPPFDNNFYSSTVLEVPAASLEKYRNSYIWEKFKNITARTCEENKFKFGIRSLTNKTASLLEYTDKAYSGNLVIPETATFDGIKHPVTSLADSACSNLKIISVSIPKTVNHIGLQTFAGCSNMKAVIVSDLAAWCNIEMQNEMSNPLYTSGSMILNDKVLENLVIPEGISQIRDYTFAGAQNLKSVTFSDDVETIGVKSFFNCPNLQKITLGKNVKSIRAGAFLSGQTQISEIRSNNPVPPELGGIPGQTKDAGAFMEKDYTAATVYVPVGSIDAYKAAEEWKEFKNIVEDASLDVESIAEDNVSVTAAGGIITVAGAGNAAVEVYAVTGQLLYRGNETAIELPVKGICIVRVNGKAFKVIL